MEEWGSFEGVKQGLRLN